MPETKKYTFGLEKNTASVLCYVFLWVSGLVFLLTEKEDKDIRFHAMQSTIFFGAVSVLYIILGAIPLIGWSLIPVVGIVSFVAWILLIVKSYQGERFKLPVVGDIAEKQLGKLE